jgi:hypothetical protein
VSTIVTPAGAATAFGLSVRGPVITKVAGRRTLLAPVVAVLAGPRGAVVVACAGPGDAGGVADEADGVLAPAAVGGGAGGGEELLVALE